MSQHDFNIANQTFPATRTDINDAILAIVSNSSGDTEPSTTYANQWWYETDTNILKIRNEANDGWVDVITLDASMTASASELSQLDAITRGSILYGNASGETARLAKGGAGTVLTSDGTDISWAAGGGGGGGTELITSVTASNDATISFTQFDSTKYDYYKFVFVNMVPATDGQVFKLRTSSDGGSNYDATQDDYKYVFNKITGFNGSFSSGVSSGVAGTQSFILDNVGASNASSLGGTSGTFEIFSPHTANYTEMIVQATSTTLSGSTKSANLSNTRGSQREFGCR